MTLAQRQASSVRRLAARFGGGAVATVRRANTLKDENAGTVVSTLAVDGTTAAGQASINLDATRVTGTLVQGATFTIAGNATTYTVAADVTASSNALAGVTFTPVLAAEAADDAAVTITQAYGDTDYPASRAQFRQSDVDGENIRLGDWKLLVDTADTIAEDAAVTFDGSRREVVQLLPLKPGEVQSGVVLHCRG